LVVESWSSNSQNARFDTFAADGLAEEYRAMRGLQLTQVTVTPHRCSKRRHQTSSRAECRLDIQLQRMSIRVGTSRVDLQVAPDRTSESAVSFRSHHALTAARDKFVVDGIEKMPHFLDHVFR
jgi:hypothetical protein